MKCSVKISASRFFVVLFCAAAMVLAVSCSAEKGAGDVAKKEQVIPVETITAGQANSAGTLVLTGTLEPVSLSQIPTKTGGICRKILVEVGDRVKKGQALAIMDTSDFALGVEQAEAAYKTGEIAAQVAKNDFDRVVELKKEDSITQADFEKAELGYQSAVHGLEQARVARDFARNRLHDATIRAPFDGQVTARMTSVGNYMDPMTNPVLFVMVDSSRLLMNLKIPEMRAHLVKVGDEVRVAVPSADRNLVTKIVALTDAVDPITHTRTATAWIENTADPVAAGIFFEARIVPEALKGKILLPASAIREADGKAAVYVIEDSHARSRELSGRWLPDHSDYVVDSGVAAGEVIIRESSMVRDGQPVTSVNPASEG